MKTCRYRIYLLSLVSIVALFRLGFTPAPSVTLCVPPPSKGRLLQRMSSRLCSYIASILLSHFSHALALSACACAPCRPPTLSACSLCHATRAAPSKGRLLQRMSSRLCSYRRQFCFRTSRPLSCPLPALALLVRPRTSPPAPSVTLRVSPPSRRETLTKSQRWLWAEKQRIICFSRGVVQRNKAHVMRLVSVLCHAVFGLGGGYTMRLSIKKRMRVLRGKIRCKNGRM